MPKIFLGIMALLCISLLSTINNPLKENNVVELAIQVVRTQASLPEETEIKLVEKRENDAFALNLLQGKREEVMRK